jgi:hypothetical protein
MDGNSGEEVGDVSGPQGWSVVKVKRERGGVIGSGDGAPDVSSTPSTVNLFPNIAAVSPQA